MSRKGNTPKRQIMPDPLYEDLSVAKFVNLVMRKGKKSLAEKIVYGAFEIVKEKEKTDPLEFFKKAIKNVRPLIEVKARRVGGSNYQVPIEVSLQRGASLAMRWIADSAAARGELSMEQRLAAEMLDAAKNTGGAVKKREDVHKMAEANKAFAHYRW